MPRTVSASRQLALGPGEALALWTDVERWPAFVEGFAHVLERDAAWPAEGSRLTWSSTPGGRGRVTERVLSRGDALLSTRVTDDALDGTQTARFEPDPEGGSLATLSLEYSLIPTGPWRRGPLGRLTDALFIRRALADSLGRTLDRLATEAAAEASR